MNPPSPQEPPDSPENKAALMDLRRDYKLANLDEADLHSDPVRQFSQWFGEAQKAALIEPNAMTLATVSLSGRPSARIVLLKGFDALGFSFFTNYESAKGRELENNPFACLVFLWQELERQVRIEGKVHKMNSQESDQYFDSRPLNSRYGALISPQSTIIKSRQSLVEREAMLRAQFGENPPRPAHWGGYRLVPEVVEFWQGRRSRLHDRLRFSRSPDLNTKTWTIDRLAP